jgi:hypothetical protein
MKRRRHLEDPSLDADVFQMDAKEGKSAPYLSVLGQGPVTVSFEHGNEPLKRIKRRGGGKLGILWSAVQLRLLKTDSAPCSQFDIR